MSYLVKSVCDTIQGEGIRAGTRAVFVRFAGCNLWNGKPEDRAKGKGMCAAWCDTDFATGEKLEADEVLRDMANCLVAPWDTGRGQPWCVLTGGEPALQVDDKLLDALHHAGWLIAMETNGTIDNDALCKVDWLTLSPKRGGEVRLRMHVHELKVVLPGALAPETGWSDAALLELASRLYPDHKLVVPMDPPLSSLTEDTLLHPRKLDLPVTVLVGAAPAELYNANLARCLDFVRKHPDWRLGAQLHKLWNLP